MKGQYDDIVRHRDRKTNSPTPASENPSAIENAVFDEAIFPDPAEEEFDEPGGEFSKDLLADPFGNEGFDLPGGAVGTTGVAAVHTSKTSPRRQLAEKDSPEWGLKVASGQHTTASVIEGSGQRHVKVPERQAKATKRRRPSRMTESTKDWVRDHVSTAETTRSDDSKPRGLPKADETAGTSRADVSRQAGSGYASAIESQETAGGRVDDLTLAHSKQEELPGEVGQAQEEPNGGMKLPDFSNEHVEDGSGDAIDGHSEENGWGWDDAGLLGPQDLVCTESEMFLDESAEREGSIVTRNPPAVCRQTTATDVQDERFPFAPHMSRKASGAGFMSDSGQRSEASDQEQDKRIETRAPGTSATGSRHLKTSGQEAGRKPGLGLPALILAVGLAASAGILTAFDPDLVSDKPQNLDLGIRRVIAGLNSPNNPVIHLDSDRDELPWQAGQMNADDKTRSFENVLGPNAGQVEVTFPPADSGEPDTHSTEAKQSGLAEEFFASDDNPLPVGEAHDNERELVSRNSEMGAASEPDVSDGLNNSAETVETANLELGPHPEVDGVAESDLETGSAPLPLSNAPLPPGDRWDFVELLDKNAAWNFASVPNASGRDEADFVQGGGGLKESGLRIPGFVGEDASAVSDLKTRMSRLEDAFSRQSDEVTRLRILASEIGAVAAKNEGVAHGNHVNEGTEDDLLRLVAAEISRMESRIEEVASELSAIVETSSRGGRVDSPSTFKGGHSDLRFPAAEIQGHAGSSPAFRLGGTVYDRMPSSWHIGTVPMASGSRAEIKTNSRLGDPFSISTAIRTVAGSYRLEDARVGDLVEGYGEVLNVVPDDIGGHLVVMERGAVYVRQ